MDTLTCLPTWVAGEWTVSDFRDSLVAGLRSDRSGAMLRLYFYAVTSSGWNELREPITRWKDQVPGRTVRLIVGTDHGITDPAALRDIRAAGVDVRVMLEYRGIFHPKVVWLRGRRRHLVWVGSNNLTRDGLSRNVEFGLHLHASAIPKPLDRWASSVEGGSVELSSQLLSSYEKERRSFENARGRAGATTFTWGQRREPAAVVGAPPASRKTLVVEVMPRETGLDGRQLQLPVRAASRFFGVTPARSTKEIHLRPEGSRHWRKLTMTIFGNRTVRLVVSDLEYRDRPCLIVFRKTRRRDRFEYEIIPRSVYPTRYQSLLATCQNQTRQGSRRWTIA